MKRFTDTCKFQDPWYRSLEPRLKLLWEFLYCNCDHAGVIEVDWAMASFMIGEAVSLSDLPAFESRVMRVGNGKLHIAKFVQFQCGELNPDCRPHASVIRLIAAHVKNGTLPDGPPPKPSRAFKGRGGGSEKGAASAKMCRDAGGTDRQEDAIITDSIPQQLRETPTPYRVKAA